MKINKKLILVIFGFFALVLISGGGYYFWQKQATTTISAKINPTDLIIFEVKLNDLTDFQKERAFKRFTNAKNTILENASETNEELRNNLNFSAWLEIAMVQKSIGDYDRAAKIWLWFNDAQPGNSISPANLGDLYKSFVVDNAKSEYYYKMAIERDKNDWYTYYSFFELYKYNFNDPEKAIAVLKDGAKNNPDVINYISELSDYLISLDRKPEAVKLIEDYIVDHPEATKLRDKLK